ncbi:hypothetical protein J2W36_001390 [Variovorax ginsengisoli]|uniref:Secreted protein n=1 Tax=Variovorax ginsengisoli TaxID=363844 RepID=A0ABT9S480_9BURK|nr:hypothetical protein [Variovorax ginsengisoli]
MFTFLVVSLLVIYALFGLGILSMARAASVSDEAMEAHSAYQGTTHPVRTQSRRMQDRHASPRTAQMPVSGLASGMVHREP